MRLLPCPGCDAARKRCFAEPGPMPTGKVDPGSESHHFMMRRVGGTRSTPLPVHDIRALLERRRKTRKGCIEHRAHQDRQHPALEFVGDEKPDVAGSLALRLKRPAVFQIGERPPQIADGYL